MRRFAAFHHAAWEELATTSVPLDGVELSVPELRTEDVSAALGALRDRRAALRERPAAEIAEVLGRVGERFADPSDPLHAEALEWLPATSGLSPAMAARVLTGMAVDWTRDRLSRLLEEEFGDPKVLDGFVDRGDRSVMAVGPRVLPQILAGSVPGVGVSAAIRALLIKSPTLIKTGAGDAVLPVLFARALRAADPEMADGLAVVYWRGGSAELERALVERADSLVVYGSDATVRALRDMAAPTTDVIAYHHRIGVAVLGASSMAPDEVAGTAERLALATAMFDQRGCVSPQLVLAEEGPDPSALVEAVGRELAALDRTLPPGPLGPAELAGVQQLRGTAEMLAAGGRATVAHGGAEATWTVVETAEDIRSPVEAGRVLLIRRWRDEADLASRLEAVGRHLQSVGVAGLAGRKEALARAFGEAGASRVVSLEAMAFPPAWWLHDGQGPLRRLVRWVESS